MDYGKLSEQIESIEGARKIGLVGSPDEKYPLYLIKRGRGKKVLLSGVVHGDEPSGAFAILEFFQKHSREFEKEFEFTAFPCVSPWGFQHGTRRNAAGFNPNREFKEETESEQNRLIIPLLEKYLFTMDFHETCAEPPDHMEGEPEGENPDDFYLWEVCKDKSRRIGDKIVASVERAGLPVCKWPMIYGDRNNGGVIWYPEGAGTQAYADGTSFDNYLADRHTAQAFAVETGGNWPMGKRVQAALISIRTVLDAKRGS